MNKNTTRDWGRGMACAGRAKECTIVPSNHFGPIPGVDVGTTWRFRFQVNALQKNFYVITLNKVFRYRLPKQVYIALRLVVYMDERKKVLTVSFSVVDTKTIWTTEIHSIIQDLVVET